MKKTKNTTKAHTTRHTSAKPLALPPLAAAIACLADQMAGVPGQFLSAYARMPALVAKLQAGDEGDARWAVIYDVSGLAWAEREAKKPKDHVGNDRMVAAVSVLNAQHEDLLADFATPLMDGAFFAGVAYACYMLTHGGSK